MTVVQQRIIESLSRRQKDSAVVLSGSEIFKAQRQLLVRFCPTYLESKSYGNIKVELFQCRYWTSINFAGREPAGYV